MTCERLKLSEAVRAIPKVRVVRIGEDAYIEKVTENVHDDLHQETRDAQDAKCEE